MPRKTIGIWRYYAVFLGCLILSFTDSGVNSIIAEKVYENQEQNNTIVKFFKKFGMADAMSKSNFYKKKGAKPIELPESVKLKLP